MRDSSNGCGHVVTRHWVFVVFTELGFWFQVYAGGLLFACVASSCVAIIACVVCALFYVGLWCGAVCLHTKHPLRGFVVSSQHYVLSWSSVFLTWLLTCDTTGQVARAGASGGPVPSLNVQACWHASFNPIRLQLTDHT